MANNNFLLGPAPGNESKKTDKKTDSQFVETNNAPYLKSAILSDKKTVHSGDLRPVKQTDSGNLEDKNADAKIHKVNLKKTTVNPVELRKKIEGDINSLRLRKFNLENAITMEKLHRDSIIPRKNAVISEQFLYVFDLMLQLFIMVIIAGILALAYLRIKQLVPSIDGKYYIILVVFAYSAYMLCSYYLYNIGPINLIKSIIKRQGLLTGFKEKEENFGAKNFKDELQQSTATLDALYVQLEIVNEIINKVLKEDNIVPAELEKNFFEYALATWDEDKSDIILKKKFGSYDLEKKRLEEDILESQKKIGELKLKKSHIIDDYRACKITLTVGMILVVLIIVITNLLVYSGNITPPTQFNIALTGLTIDSIILAYLYFTCLPPYIAYNVEMQTGKFDMYAFDHDMESTDIQKAAEFKKLESLNTRFQFINKVLNEVDLSDS